jgi:hypothetical protein
VRWVARQPTRRSAVSRLSNDFIILILSVNYTVHSLDGQSHEADGSAIGVRITRVSGVAQSVLSLLVSNSRLGDMPAPS